jgi:hypothetical protein
MQLTTWRLSIVRLLHAVTTEILHHGNNDSCFCHLHKMVYRPTTVSVSHDQTALTVFTPTDSVTWYAVRFLWHYTVQKQSLITYHRIILACY